MIVKSSYIWCEPTTVTPSPQDCKISEYIGFGLSSTTSMSGTKWNKILAINIQLYTRNAALASYEGTDSMQNHPARTIGVGIDQSTVLSVIIDLFCSIVVQCKRHKSQAVIRSASRKTVRGDRDDWKIKLLYMQVWSVCLCFLSLHWL